MRQRLLGTFLWLLFVPLSGAARLLWSILRSFLWMRFPGQIVLVGLFVVLRQANPLTAQVSTEGIATLGLAILPWTITGLGIVIGVLGARSRAARWLRHVLERRRWFLGVPSPDWLA